MDRFSLEEILNSDPYGVLNDIKAKNPVISADDRLVASFKEVNEFYQKHKREPQKSSDIHERRLYARLKAIREDAKKREALKKYDRYGLLEIVQELKSIDDILQSDPLGILDEEEDIFTLKNVPKIPDKIDMPEEKAKAKVCEDFEKFEPMFKQVHKELKNGSRRMESFSREQDIEKGSFFVLKGVVVYIADKGVLKSVKGRKNTRLRVIYENGKESNLLMRSLSRELYRDGKRVSESNELIVEKFSQISEQDKQKGYIYILKSLSKEDVIATKRNLYKIGFSTTPVEQRIKNAKNDPTYLMADVKIVSAYEVYNVNPQKLEQLIHKFFNKSRLDLEIVGKDGKIYQPKEWFIAPLGVIEEAINLIINGRIVDFVYDEKSEKIILKK